MSTEPLAFHAVRISRVPLYTVNPETGGMVWLEDRRRQRAAARARARQQRLWAAAIVASLVVVAVGVLTGWQAAMAIVHAVVGGPLG